ncbi:MAG TPA: glycoside hydrolase family 5 protein [Chitinophagaceae bacterium]|nr:glycoside hydrolase family 5 protein [Chitinophagaceae bacterium]
MLQALNIRKLILFLLGFWISSPISAQQFVRVKGKILVSPNGQELHLKGIGLGNWLVQEGYMWGLGRDYSAPHEIKDLVRELIGEDNAEQFWEKYYANYVSSSDIAFLKSCGFNSVRVPFDYRLLNPDALPGIFAGPGWQALDDVIRWCKANKLYVILDMHCAPGGETGANIDDSWGYPFLYETPASQERLIRLWTHIAERYRNEPAVLGYDLMNEPLPHREFYDRLVPKLEPIYKRVTAAIRKVDKNHIIILEGPNWDSNFDGFHAPFDSKLVYEFHHYWSDPTVNGIKPFLAFRDKYQVPIWLGESGENTNSWVDSFRVTLESNDIGWSFWTYKKIRSPRGVVTIKPPEGWSKIVAFSQSSPGVETREARHDRDSIPPPLAMEVLNGWLSRIKLDSCHVNGGFLEALGLHAPGK